MLREAIASFKTLQVVDVHLPTTGGREPTQSRCTQPEAERRMPLDPLRLSLPGRPPPKLSAARQTSRRRTRRAVQTSRSRTSRSSDLAAGSGANRE